MGKHKYSKRELEDAKKLADKLEEYINTVQSLIIPVGASVEKMENAEKVVRKAIKNLRDGKLHKVYADPDDDSDSYNDLEEEDPNFFDK